MEFLHNLLGTDTHDIQWWQMCLRAVLILLVGVALVRFSGKRAFSRSSALDIVVTIVLGSNLSRALTGNAPFFPVLIATTVLVVLYRILAQLSRSGGMFEFWIKGRQVALITGGQLEPQAMRSESLSKDDLYEALREQGIDDPAKVRLSMLERGGQISVLKD